MKIPLIEHTKENQIDYRKAPKILVLKLSNDQLGSLKHMVHVCMAYTADTSPLGLLALRELCDIIAKKEITEQKKIKLKLPASYACTLFLCLNLVDFEDSHLHILSCRIIEDIYKQLI